MRLTAQGECGVRGGGIGDLFVKVTVEPHPTLRKEGDDLRCEIPISFAKAALGGEIRVPTLTGTAVLHIPKGTQGNQLFRLAGQGIQKADGRCGDLFVTVIIEVPTSLTWKQEQLLKEYAELEERAAAFRRRDTQR